MKYTPEFIQKFWSNVKRGPKCWIWLKGKTKAGYGQLQARKISQAPLLAHRVSWELSHGSIPNKLHVLHECDNPACVRPKHLFLGTQIDNNEDRDRKNRTAKGDRNGSRTHPERNPFVRNRGSGLKGERHPMVKLSDKEVHQLLMDYQTGVIKAKLAKKYNISQTHVGRLISQKSRKSGPRPNPRKMRPGGY